MRSVVHTIRNPVSRKRLAVPGRDEEAACIQREDMGEAEREWVFDPPLGPTR